MAGLDYGVMVFRNGEQIYKDRLYPDVEVNDIKISCYKCWCDIKTRCDAISFFQAYQDKPNLNLRYDPKSTWFRSGGFNFHLDEVCWDVYRLRFSIDDQHYTIIYGYGIDNDMDVWDKIKVLYLGKKRARAVDRAISKANYAMK